MASVTVDPIDWLQPPPSWAVPPELLVHSINRCSSSTDGIRSCNLAKFSMLCIYGHKGYKCVCSTLLDTNWSFVSSYKKILYGAFSILFKFYFSEIIYVINMVLRYTRSNSALLQWPPTLPLHVPNNCYNTWASTDYDLVCHLLVTPFTSLSTSTSPPSLVVLQMDKSTGLDDLGPPNTGLILCGFITYLILYLSLFKGVKSSGSWQRLNNMKQLKTLCMFNGFPSNHIIMIF